MALTTISPAMQQRLGDTLLVNGTYGPYLDVTTERVRLRLLNASNARPYNFHLSDDRPFQQIASDGGYLAEPVTLNDPSDPTSPRLVIAPTSIGDCLPATQWAVQLAVVAVPDELRRARAAARETARLSPRRHARTSAGASRRQDGGNPLLPSRSAADNEHAGTQLSAAARSAVERCARADARPALNRSE